MRLDGREKEKEKRPAGTADKRDTMLASAEEKEKAKTKEKAGDMDRGRTTMSVRSWRQKAKKTGTRPHSSHRW